MLFLALQSVFTRPEQVKVSLCHMANLGGVFFVFFRGFGKIWNSCWENVLITGSFPCEGISCFRYFIQKTRKTDTVCSNIKPACWVIYSKILWNCLAGQFWRGRKGGPL